MEESMRAAQGLRYGCPGCGSGLQYDIASGKMHCANCGQRYDMDQIPDQSLQSEDGLMEATEYRCPQCGAAVHASQTAATSFCSYCGADVILAQRLTRVMRPDQVVPFRVTREQCEQIFRRRVQQARFTPEDFAAQETLSHFRPVYIPFWRYTGHAQGEGLIGLATHKHSDRRYEYTDEYGYDVSGSADVSGVIYDASVSFEDETAQHLRFSTKHAVPFHPGYLCGFSAETPDTQPTLYQNGLLEFAQNAWTERFKSECGIGYTSHQAQFPDKSFESRADMMLMPVWLLAHRTGGRVVYTAINGDSGEIICDTPISNKRFGLLTAALAGLFAAALLLLQFVLLLRPKPLAALCGLTAATAQWIIAAVSKDLQTRRTRGNDLTWSTLHPAAETKKQTKKKQAAKKKKTQDTARIRWHVPPLGTAMLVVVLLFVNLSGGGNLNALIAGLISDRGWLAPVVLACSVLAFVLSGEKLLSTASKLLFAARLVVLAATLISLAFTNADPWFYGCCVAMLALTAVAMLRLNREHNEYVSRPVPFFGKEGMQE